MKMVEMYKGKRTDSRGAGLAGPQIDYRCDDLIDRTGRIVFLVESLIEPEPHLVRTRIRGMQAV